ncbi:hypothetical protein AVEN_66853-1 [Araneus ventricosus]|uniref:Uncharacterized protein n=1 Tax=Araneus ventricosus TaxID=182803 RepID=A0A4Y2UIE5_ARAVE|nr:hypothetical protein AVEN_66853-1 [Araneus ventricosus]
MVPSSCMTIPILLAKLKSFAKVQMGSLERHAIHSPDLTPNLCSKHLSVKGFSSDSDMRTDAENWLNWQGRDFCQADLNKLSCVQIND